MHFHFNMAAFMQQLLFRQLCTKHFKKFAADAFRVGFSLLCRRYAHTTPSLDVVKEMSDRGLIEAVYPSTRSDELSTLLSSSQSMYCGFDPTADSLHIGNLVSLIALLHAQRYGHTPIAVLGGATALIGDPSGKSKERKAMTAEDVENNIIGLMENVKRIFDNHSQYIASSETNFPPLMIVNNREWYEDQDVISFLSTTGRHFRLGEMISRASVQSRLNSSEGISCTEFMYQIFQANDWLHLHQKYNCSFQIGGNDQTGNIASGFHLIHRVTGKYAFGLLVPLMLSSSGQKLGKSAGNSVWLDPKRSSPFELYQYFYNLPDTAVDRFLNLYTFLSFDEIAAVMEKQTSAPEQRIGQRTIAEQVTLLVHGRAGVESAQRCTDVLFSNSVLALANMELSELQQLMKNAPTFEMPVKPELCVKDLCGLINCFKREEDADRIIKAGGLYINQQRVTDPTLQVGADSVILPNNVTLIRVGKKNFYLVKWLM